MYGYFSKAGKPSLIHEIHTYHFKHQTINGIKQENPPLRDMAKRHLIREKYKIKKQVPL